MNIRQIGRTVFNSIALGIFYRPLFKAGDIVVPKGIEIGNPVDLPRFEGDSLIHVLGDFPIKIARFSRGEYSSRNPNSEFVHSKLGNPHYEIQVLEHGGAFDNYGRRELPVGSLIHVDAQILDSRFQKATLPRVYVS